MTVLTNPQCRTVGYMYVIMQQVTSVNIEKFDFFLEVFVVTYRLS